MLHKIVSLCIISPLKPTVDYSSNPVHHHYHRLHIMHCMEVGEAVAIAAIDACGVWRVARVISRD